MKPRLLALAAGLLLTGCAGAPQSPAAAADDVACTQAANATYRANTVNLLARIPQTDSRYGMPSQVFQSEQMGAENARALQIQRCEKIGNQDGTPTVNGVPVVTPQILN